MSVIGIDEAGRGPVIGSLFMAGVVVKPSQKQILKKWGVKDSKLINAEKRELLYEKIINKFPHKIISFSAQEIDEVLAKGHHLNLNKLEARGHAELVNAFELTKAIIDCPQKNTKGFTDYLRPMISDKNILLVVENKADSNYLEAAAASILAKVSRDREIRSLHQEIGIDFGSGYLTDPKTQPFLQAHWNTYPHLFRTQWAPYKALKEKTAQPGLSSFM